LIDELIKELEAILLDHVLNTNECLDRIKDLLARTRAFKEMELFECPTEKIYTETGI
jgi:hypothetical protein